jgi:hypothetical protein
MRGSLISTEKSMQTPVRCSAPPHPIAPRVIRMTYPSYVFTRRYRMRGPVISTEKSMETLVRGPAPPHPIAP